MKRLDRIKEILETAVNHETIGQHGNFWRGLTRDQFVAKKVFQKTLVTVGDPENSNLVLALEGRLPFGRDTGTATATFRRMPAGRPPVAANDIAFIRQWIADGCPDDDVVGES